MDGTWAGVIPAADPLSVAELTSLGAGWLAGGGDQSLKRALRGGAPNAPYVTRLHVRCDAVSFPEDLIFVETGDRANFQGRYIMWHQAVWPRHTGPNYRRA